MAAQYDEDFSTWFEEFANTFATLSPTKRQEFNERWLQLCSASEVAHLAKTCEEMSYRDFVVELPPELVPLILQHLDWKSLLCSMRVSARWRQVIIERGRGVWLNKHWPWPVDLGRHPVYTSGHRGSATDPSDTAAVSSGGISATSSVAAAVSSGAVCAGHPYDIVLGELRWRKRLDNRLLQCNLTMCTPSEASAEALVEVSEGERLSAIAWNGEGLLAAFPHHPQGVICRVLNPKPFLGIAETTPLSFSVPGGCRKAKFLRPNDLFLASYSAFHILKVTFDNDLKTVEQAFHGHTNLVLDFVALEGPGGNHLVSLSRDQTVKLWDYTTAECCVTVNLDPALKPVSVAAGCLASGPSSAGQDSIAVAVYFQECVKLMCIPMDVKQILAAEGPHVLLRVSGFKGPAKGDVVLLRGHTLYFTGVTSVVAVHLKLSQDGQVLSHTVNRLLLDTKSRLQAIVPVALHPLSAASDHGVLYALSDLSIWQWTDDGQGGRSEMVKRDRLCPGLRDSRIKAAHPGLVCLNWPLITARTVAVSRPVIISSPSGFLSFSSFFLENNSRNPSETATV
ncbi:uncharacterized protein LOC135823097 [Sycon ciliatum]|uniref:uncharacterized protein LOC135823097 n=1 Tax=Sycon ciliatum TaxID=27933 RepID=UPI0031F6B9F9